MRLVISGFAVLVGVLASANAQGSIEFDTISTARQTISSPLYAPIGGSLVIEAHGTQHFSIDLASGTANVTSDFTGHDLLTPVGIASYKLYNTITTGTVTPNGPGYDVSFSLLFELMIVGGPLDGLTFETLTNSIFTTTAVAGFPFPAGTVFADPASDDTTNVFVKSDPTGTFPAGAPFGTSSGRTVTVNAVLPEPSTIVSAAVASLMGLGVLLRRKSR